MNRRIVELFAAGVVGLIFAGGFWEAWSYRGQSSYMPIAVTGLALILCMAWAAQSVRLLATGAADRYEVTTSDFLRFALILAATIVYVLGIAHVGFFTSTIILVPALSFALGYRHLRVAFLVTAGFSVILYCVFEILLAIPLPPELIVSAFGVQ